MNKKYIFIALIIISCISFVTMLFINKDEKYKTENKEFFQQKLNIPNYFENSKIYIENNISKSEFNFPKNLPYIEKSKTNISIQKLMKISQNLGFTDNYIEVEDIQDDKIFIWNNNEMNLKIIPKHNSIYYSSNRNYSDLVNDSINKYFTDDDFISLSKKFISQNLDIEESKLFFIDTKYYKANQGSEENLIESNKNDYDLIQLNFSENTSQLPIFTTDPQKSQIYTIFTRDGKITNLEAEIGYQFNKSINNYPIMNYEDFLTNLNSAILVSLNDNNINIPDVKISDLNKITAEKASIIYLSETPQQSILQPVFLIHGTTFLNQKKINAIFYLPAYKKQTNFEP